METRFYYAALYQDKNEDGFGLAFPDFPGCVTSGESLEELAKNAEEALSLHVEGMQDDGENIPIPSPLDVIKKNRDYKLASAFIVVPLVIKSRQVNVTLSIDEAILRLVDRSYKELGYSTRSALFADAVQRRLQA